jgi:hypothetical protein
MGHQRPAIVLLGFTIPVPDKYHEKTGEVN